MLHLPLDCLINISAFLPDKDKFSLTHTSKRFHSIQRFITLESTPLFPANPIKFQTSRYYWFYDLPIPETNIIIIKPPPDITIPDNFTFQIPDELSNISNLTIPYNINPRLPNFSRLTSLTLSQVSTNLTLPTTIEHLHIYFFIPEDIFSDNGVTLYQVTNLSELSNLTIFITNMAPQTFDFSNHLSLHTLIVEGMFGYNMNFLVNSSLNESLFTIIQPEYSFDLDLSLIPNLRELETSVCISDINIPNDIEHLMIKCYIEPGLHMENFLNLVSLDIHETDHPVGFGDVVLNNLEIMKVPYISKINKILYPKLLECEIRAGYCDDYDDNNPEMNYLLVDHDGLLKLDISWEGKVELRNLKALASLKCHILDFDCLNDVVCRFDLLEYLELISMDVRKEIDRINLENMPGLEVLNSKKQNIVVTGQNCSLAEIRGRVKIVDCDGIDVVEELDVLELYPSLDVDGLNWG